MQAYEENISAKVSGVLAPILGVKVTVTDISTGKPAALYSDNGVTPTNNPLETDETGYFGFFAANGNYRLTFSSQQITLDPRDVNLYDSRDDPPLTQAQAAAPTGASSLGYGPRSVANKLDDALNAKDRGAKADGATDDATAVATAAAALAVRSYSVTAYNNPFGHNVTPDGVAEHATTKRVFNPSKHRYMHTFGAEVMQHWFNLFAGNSNTVTSGDGYIKNIIISGDSVTYGYGNTAAGVPATILDILAGRRGYKNVQVINRGQSGKACFQWLTDYLAGDLALNPDLLILGWGDNDFGLGRTPDQLLADYRTGLATIRASKTPAQLSIILRTPTSMTDPINNRTGFQIERIIEGFKQLARDFQCGFVDVYSICQNSHDAAGVWMDNISGGAVHPLDVMQEHIWGAIADLALPDRGSAWQNNGFYNWSSAISSHVRAGADGPDTFFSGITFARTSGGSSAGAPYDGICVMWKQTDSAGVQWSYPLYGITAGYGLSARLAFNNSFGPWLGSTNTVGTGGGAPAFQNSWTQQPSAPTVSYYLTLEGAVTLQGAAKAGTTTDLTTVFTLPNGYRPSLQVVCVVATDIGIGRVIIQTDGQVKVYGVGACSYIYLNGVQFKG